MKNVVAPAPTRAAKMLNHSSMWAAFVLRTGSADVMGVSPVEVGRPMSSAITGDMDLPSSPLWKTQHVGNIAGGDHAALPAGLKPFWMEVAKKARLGMPLFQLASSVGQPARTNCPRPSRTSFPTERFGAVTKRTPSSQQCPQTVRFRPPSLYAPHSGDVSTVL
jgi:hypothetical protein